MKKILAALLLALLVCGPGCSASKDDTKKKKETDDHDHGPGPHKGTIIEFRGGHDYHGEFTVDHPKAEVRVYILDKDAKTAKPIKADKLILKITEPNLGDSFELKPLWQEGDTEGTASCFSVVDQKFAKEQDFAGEVTMKIGDKQYSGKFREEAGHEHEGK